MQSSDLKNSVNPARGPLLNLQNFTYIINNDVCQQKEVFAIIIVHSHPANRERRDVIRRNIPREDLMKIGVRRRTPQDQISEENVIHRDIIQGNFKEHYHNLTYKHVMGLQWVNTFCNQAKYIIKMDDDIIVDIYRYRDILKYRYENRDNLIVGLLVIEGPVIRNTKSKWYVNEKEYAEMKYPNFMSGWAYAMSTDASKKIVNLSQRASYFWIDDVFVTGILAEAAGVKREGLN
ncbi:UNVERIFIED_CONTAM: hypothetical protein GTU68_024661, partial [Idotea baltica]|nr:hypothetical protein [Idotea baltica]